MLCLTNDLFIWLWNRLVYVNDVTALVKLCTLDYNNGNDAYVDDGSIVVDINDDDYVDDNEDDNGYDNNADNDDNC